MMIYILIVFFGLVVSMLVIRSIISPGKPVAFKDENRNQFSRF